LLPTAAARVRSQVRSCGICEQSGTGAGFLRVLRFPLPIFIPPIAPQSTSSIIWGWYSRPVVAAVPSGLSLTSLKNNNNNKIGPYMPDFTALHPQGRNLHVVHFIFFTKLASGYMVAFILGQETQASFIYEYKQEGPIVGLLSPSLGSNLCPSINNHSFQ
jgi:hypothetical protein